MELCSSRIASKTSVLGSRSLSAKPVRRILGNGRENIQNYEFTRSRKFVDEEVKPEFTEMRNELLSLLATKNSMWCLLDIMSTYIKETGKDPVRIAFEFGYPSFEDMLKSKEFASYIDIEKEGYDVGDVEASYMLKSGLGIKPMRLKGRKEKEIAVVNEDYRRAMIEVGAEKLIENMITILDLLAALGADRNSVPLQHLAASYKATYGEELNKYEFKRLFGYRHAKDVFEKIFSEELDVIFSAHNNGQFWLQMKRSYASLRQSLLETQKKLARPIKPELDYSDSDDPREEVKLKKRHRFESDSSEFETIFVKSPINKSPNREQERDPRRKLRSRQPSRFNDPSSSPEPSIEKRLVDVPRARTASKDLSFKNVARSENERYKSGEVAIKNGNLFVTEEFESSKKSSKMPTSKRDVGIYSDNEKGSTIRKPKITPQTIEDDDLGEKSAWKEAESEEVDLTNCKSHGEKWLRLQKKKEEEDYQKELRKIEHREQHLRERKEELERQKKEKKNFLVQKIDKIPETVTIKTIGKSLVVDEEDEEAKTASHNRMTLNDRSTSIKLASKNNKNIASESEEDESNESGKGSSGSTSNSSPPQTMRKKKPSSSTSLHAKQRSNSRWDDETALPFRLLEMKVNNLDYETRKQLIQKFLKMAEEAEARMHTRKSSNRCE